MQQTRTVFLGNPLIQRGQSHNKAECGLAQRLIRAGPNGKKKPEPAVIARLAGEPLTEEKERCVKVLMRCMVKYIGEIWYNAKRPAGTPGSSRAYRLC